MRGALLLVALASLPAYADDPAPPPPTPFDRGRVAITAGGGVGYYVLDGVRIDDSVYPDITFGFTL